MAETKLSSVDEYGFERPASFDYESYGVFMSKYVGILARRSKRWEECRNLEKYKKNNMLKRFVRKGVPMALRAEIWMAVSGGALLKEQSAYSYVQIKAKVAKGEITEMIEIDLPRTFPENIYFNKENILPRQLYNVLATFAQQNVDVGYCQGLNYIAGLLLLATRSEENSFWLLKCLVENILPKYYIRSMAGLITDLAVLDELVKLREPQVHQHITNIGVPWAVTTTKWFICLYAEVLPTETVFRIWDCLFNEGSKVIFRVALTLIKLHKEEILASRDLADVVTCFKQMTLNPQHIDCHQLMTNIFKVPGSLPKKLIDDLRQKHSPK